MAEVEKVSMTLEEYMALPESLNPTEFINGEVLSSPASTSSHQLTSVAIFQMLNQMIPDGQLVYAPADVVLGEHNVQPDIFWIAKDGHCKVVENRYWKGAPDLVVEILSPSTARMDKEDKFAIYEEYGVREYWIVDPIYGTIQVFALKEQIFVQQGEFYQEDSYISTVLGNQTITLKHIFPMAEDK